MRNIIFTFIGTGLIFSGCETSNPRPYYSIGQGLEIYMAKHINSFNSGLDYTQIVLDTVQLQEKPIISYNDIKKYNLQNHVAELTITVDKIKGYKPSVYGHMFIVTVDKERIYCGFFRPLLSSAMLDWVIIDEAIDGKE
jgi:hypothetical protein